MVATNLNKVTVTAQYVDFDGNPMAGSVQFTPLLIAIDVPGKKILMPKVYIGNLDASGILSIPIPASDDPDILPNIITYRVVENIQGGRTFENIQIPYAFVSTSFDLSTVLIDGAASTGPTYLSTSDATAVHKTGDETIAGIKTFSVSPIVPTPTTASQATTKAYVDGVAISGSPDATSAVKGILKLTGALGGTADSPATPTAVHVSGNETVAGIKAFTSSPTVPTPTTSTQVANKAYADSVVPPDASTIVKGIVQLANDLGGTATSPTTPTAVHLTGNETVAGIKTFSSSPIVPTPTTSTQAANKSYVDANSSLGDLPNAVTDHGADPTGVADSASALNAWMAAAKVAKTSGYLPPGNYRIDSTVQVNGAVGCPGIIGSPGMSIGSSFTAGARIFWGGAAGGTMIEINNIRSSPFTDFELDGMNVAAIGIDYGGPITTGITTSRCWFERVGVYNCTDKGVRVGKGHLQADLTSWKDCVFQSCGTGVSFEWSQAVNHTFYSCAFASNDIAVDELFDGTSSGQFDMFGCSFGSNATGDHTPALRLSNTRQHTLVACFMEGGGYLLLGPGGSASSSPCTLIGCIVNTLTELGAPGSHDGIGIRWPGRSALIIIGGYFKTGKTNGFTIDAGVGGGLSPVVVIGASFPDAQPVFPGTYDGGNIYSINNVYQGSGTSTAISGAGSVPLGTAAVPYGIVHTASASAALTNYAGAAWLRIPSGTNLVAGLNTFYVRSLLCTGTTTVTVDIATVGGLTTQLQGIHARDNNASTANTALIIVRMGAGPFVLTSDMVFKVTFNREPVVSTA
jgi:hypothetical protein